MYTPGGSKTLSAIVVTVEVEFVINPTFLPCSLKLTLLVPRIL